MRFCIQNSNGKYLISDGRLASIDGEIVGVTEDMQVVMAKKTIDGE